MTIYYQISVEVEPGVVKSTDEHTELEKAYRQAFEQIIYPIEKYTCDEYFLKLYGNDTSLAYDNMIKKGYYDLYGMCYFYYDEGCPPTIESIKLVIKNK